MHFIIVLYFVKLNHTGLIFSICVFLFDFCGAYITLSTFFVGFAQVSWIHIRDFLKGLPELPLVQHEIV